MQEFRLQSKQKMLLCRLNSPLRLKRKPWDHLAVGVQDVVGIEGEQEAPRDVSSVGRSEPHLLPATSTAPVSNTARVGCKLLPSKALDNYGTQ